MQATVEITRPIQRKDSTPRSREFDSNIKQVYDLAVGFQGLFFPAIPTASITPHTCEVMRLIGLEPQQITSARQLNTRRTHMIQPICLFFSSCSRSMRHRTLARSWRTLPAQNHYPYPGPREGSHIQPARPPTEQAIANCIPARCRP